MSAEALIVDSAAFFSETKDIVQYYIENIRGVYGPYIEGIDISKYDGSVKDIVTAIIRDSGQQVEIDAKIDLFADELPYAYYNVAGHDSITVRPGVKEFMSRIGKNMFIVGIGTNDLSEITKIKFDRAGLSTGAFKFQEYGSASRKSADVINASLADIEALGVDKSYAVMASASQAMIDSANAMGIRTIAIDNGKRIQGANTIIRDFRDIIGVAIKL